MTVLDDRLPAGERVQRAQLPVRWLIRLFCAAALFSAGGAILGSLFWPFGRDQGVFAWVGDVILRGGAPYADAWEQKGPATHYVFAGLQALFGRSMWSVRLFDAVCVIGVGLLLARLLRRRAGSLAAIVATVIFVELHYRLGFWSTAQPDAWAGMAAGAALLILEGGRGQGTGARRRAKHWEWVAGALLGLAVMFKLTLLVLCLPVAVHLLVGVHPGHDSAQNRWSAVRGQLARLVSGAAAVVLLFTILLATRGGLGAFLEIQFEFNPKVHLGAHSRGALEHLEALWKLIDERALEVPISLALVTLPLALRTARRLVWTLGTAALSACALIVIQNKYYDYHAAPMFLPVAALAGIGVASARSWLESVTHSAWGRLAWVALLWAALFSVRSRWNMDGWRAFVTGTGDRATYHESFGWPGGEFWFPETLEVAALVERTTEPEDRVTVFGFEPAILFLSGRVGPTRFGFRYPLTAARGFGLVEDYRVEFMDAMNANPPTLVVVGERDQNNLQPKSSAEEAKELGLAELLRRGYSLESSFESYSVYRRR